MWGWALAPRQQGGSGVSQWLSTPLFPSQASCNKLLQDSPSGPAVPRLLLQHLRGLHLGCEETRGRLGTPEAP